LKPGRRATGLVGIPFPDEGGAGGEVRLITSMQQVQPPTSPSKEGASGPGELSDLELVAEVLRKDRKASAEFVARSADCVYGYVWRRLVPRADLVEDLVQEVFLAAWENLDKFRGDSSLRSWLLGIARHKVEDHYRKRLRELQLPEEEENPQGELVDIGDLDEGLALRQAGQRTREVLASLPEIYSVMLSWRYWGGRSLRDMASETGKTEKAIERLLARARTQFKKRWDERQTLPGR
jgi:RNA polymerase sigma-70 factor, ECF subfamily